MKKCYVVLNCDPKNLNIFSKLITTHKKYAVVHYLKYIEGKKSFSVAIGMRACNRVPPTTRPSISVHKLTPLRKKNVGQINCNK